MHMKIELLLPAKYEKLVKIKRAEQENCFL